MCVCVVFFFFGGESLKTCHQPSHTVYCGHIDAVSVTIDVQNWTHG